MKLCPHCSASLEDDTVKCRRCGKWVVPKRDVALPKKRGGSGWKRLAILGGLAALAAAVWAMPDGTVNPREFLDLKPARSSVLRSMRGDLGRLATLQEDFFGTSGNYAGNPYALGFAASDGVSVSLIATPTGWSATATHQDHSSAVGCAVFGGSASPPQSPVIPTEPGVPACTGGAS